MRVDSCGNIAILCRVVCFGQLPFGTYYQLLVAVPVESDRDVIRRVISHTFLLKVSKVKGIA